MRARAVLRDFLRAARRRAGTGLDDLNNKDMSEIFLKDSIIKIFKEAGNYNARGKRRRSEVETA